MDCPKCNKPLNIAKSYLTFVNDDTPNTPTEAFRNLDMVCINERCDMYAGKDLTQPNKVVDTIKNREV